MKHAVLLLALVCSLEARADIPNPDPAPMPDVSCVGKEEGTACGVGGTCRKLRVRRPDFTSGKPVWTAVDVMVCDGATATSPARAVVSLVAAALLAWWLVRRGRNSAQLA